MQGRLWLSVGGFMGFLAVGAGAFGAHALKARLSPEALEIFDVGARYHLLHAVCLLVVGVLACDSPRFGARSRRPLSLAGWAFSLGIVIFSGSLYALALTGVKWLGAITPLGGLSLMAGWVLLAVAGLRRGEAVKPLDSRKSEVHEVVEAPGEKSL